MKGQYAFGLVDEWLSGEEGTLVHSTLLSTACARGLQAPQAVTRRDLTLNGLFPGDFVVQFAFVLFLSYARHGSIPAHDRMMGGDGARRDIVSLHWQKRRRQLQVQSAG